MKFFMPIAKRFVWLVLILFCAYQLWLFAHLLYWKWVNPTETSFMSLRLSELQEKNSKAVLQYTWVPYEKISIHLKRAVVASEDDRFMEHNGFDWLGMQKAFEKNQRKGKSIAGGSTITQQLAKNLFLSPSRSYIRKGQEAVIALMIEILWDKRRILEVYLNVVEWGTGVFGAEAAAQHYYQQHASTLSGEQAVRIAVMLPNPRKFEKRYPGYVASHAQRVLERMRYSVVP
jgi:monofunctional glycosyltransferase